MLLLAGSGLLGLLSVLLLDWPRLLRLLGTRFLNGPGLLGLLRVLTLLWRGLLCLLRVLLLNRLRLLRVLPLRELNYVAASYKQVLTAEGLVAFVDVSDGFGKPGTAQLELLNYKTKTLYGDTGLSYPLIRTRD